MLKWFYAKVVYYYLKSASAFPNNGFLWNNFPIILTDKKKENCKQLNPQADTNYTESPLIQPIRYSHLAEKSNQLPMFRHS